MPVANQEKTNHPSASEGLGPAPWIECPPPGPNAKALMEQDERWTSPSYTRDFPLAVRRALGCVVEDVDGNRFLDFTAGIAVCATGHCHPKVVAAIEAQARTLIHMCGCDFFYPSIAALSERMAGLVSDGAPWRVFFANSGTETVEAAFKLARYHTKRNWVIAFHGAFHGRSMGALSLTCSKNRQRAGFGPLVPQTAHVPYGDADAIESTLFRYQMEPGEVAAIFVEAFQGEGGYVIPPPDFLKKLRTMCDKHGILLVCDEIQSGIGRTGKWFAFEHFGVTPDVILTAKGIASGLPLGVMLARKEIMDWAPSAHASTFGGNPVACAAALATLDLVESTYMANAAAMGDVVHSKLQALAEKHAALVNPRGLGLMRAMDIVNPKTGQGDADLRGKILNEAFNKGLIMLGCGEISIRFCPPLCIEKDQIDTGMKILDEVVASVA